MLKIEDIIKKLQELNEEDYTIELEVEPIVDCVEQYDGTGFETTKYRYTIVLENKNAIIRKYKNKFGYKEYIDKLEGKE